MLSNHPPRLHRRQNSTPSAFQGVKKPSVPAAAARPSRAAAHRRGLSLDTRPQRIAAAPATPAARRDLMVSTSTNETGLGNNSQHDLLREAQQQRTPARPGPDQQQRHQHHQNHHHQVYFSPQPSSDIENYLTPHGTPQLQPFDAASFDPTHPSLGEPPSLGDYASQLSLSSSPFSPVVPDNTDFDLFVHDSAHSTPSFPNFQESPASQGYISEGDTSSTRKTLRRVSNGIKDRVERFEGYALDNVQWPITPPDQNGLGDFPLTPMETPQEPGIKQQSQPGLDEDFDDWMAETIKPNRGKPMNQSQNAFQDLRRQAEEQPLGHRPGSSSMPRNPGNPQPMPDFAGQMNMNPFGSDLVGTDGSFHGARPGSPQSFGMPPDMSPLPSPGAPHMGGLISGFEDWFDFQTADGTMRAPEASSSRAGSHRRNDSMASATSESIASISGLNIEETKTDTGITLDDIAQHISGPDAADGKWMCIFQGCGKKFGRKENIKSHVQTHLNDRQYKCPTCLKRFVRQHDLKRHAKIHTGNKPYDCQCGNSFARHDALTRHRQRGMCVGAFDGVVRKPVKRGRPRKHRPEMEQRVEKSARQRRKNNVSISSMSSQSGFSDSSVAPSPADDFDMMAEAFNGGGTINDGSIINGSGTINGGGTIGGGGGSTIGGGGGSTIRGSQCSDSGMSSQMHGMSAGSTAPMPTLAGPPLNDPAFSPRPGTPHSCISPGAIMQESPSHPESLDFFYFPNDS